MTHREISGWTQQVLDALGKTEHEVEGEPTYGAMAGQKYDRIFVNISGTQRTVQCFVERETGDIHYAAGWKYPAKWSDGPAVEWHANEAERYADYVASGGWGYKGGRAKYDADHPQSVVVPLSEPDLDDLDDFEVSDPRLPTEFDIKALATLVASAKHTVDHMSIHGDFDAYMLAVHRWTAYRTAWATLTGTLDPDVTDAEIEAVLARTGHTAHTSDLT